jgi:hypothetical protein
MFKIDEKYLLNKPFKPSDFIHKDIARNDKKRLKEIIKSANLKYQIKGEEIPSVMDENYNYQVIMFFEIELNNIKNAVFVNNILQKQVIKAPCVFKFSDMTSFCYAFADKRLSLQESKEIVIEDTVISRIQALANFTDERLKFANIKNKSNKKTFYTELMVKTFIVSNIKLVSDLESVFDVSLWYDERKKMELFYKLKALSKLQELQLKTSVQKEKVEINSQMKILIEEIKEFYKEYA